MTGFIEDLEYSEFVLEGDWGFFSISMMTQRIVEVDEQGKYEILIYEFYNGFELERHTNLQDFYYTDDLESPNIVGLGTYVGFIGDIFYSNCFVVEDWLAFVQTITDCPGCVSCPVHPDDVICKLECEGDSSCVSECENPVDTLCVDHCSVGSRSSHLTGDLDAGLHSCDPCYNECASCRYEHTCYTCDDTLCAVCGIYGICESCVSGTKPESYATGCECLDDYNHDPVHQACCFPTCIECYQTGECITCWPGYIGENCDIPCSGNGVGDKTGCICDPGWSGDVCNIACDSACKTCRQDDPMYCTSCFGLVIGSRCEKCPGGFVFPDCTGCPPGQYNLEGTDDCLDCHERCASCSGPGPGRCTECQPSYLTFEIEDTDIILCLTECGTGFIS